MSVDPSTQPRRVRDFALQVVTQREDDLRAGTPSLRDRTLLRYGVRPWFVLVDGLSVLLATFVVTGHIGQVGIASTVVLLALLQHRGLHDSRLTLSVLDDLPALLVRSVATSAAGVLVATWLSPAGVLDTGPLAVLAVQGPFLIGLRAIAYTMVREVRSRGVVGHPTVILGAGHVGGQLAQTLLDHPEFGLLPVGFLDNAPFLPRDERPVPLLGSLDELAKVLVEFEIRNVVVAFGGAPESDLIGLLRTCDRLDCEILAVPRLFEVHATTRDMESVWGLPLVRLRRAAFRRFSWKLKRVLDVTVAGLALLLLGPALLACAVAVRLETGPGFLFRQTRVGMDGRPFQLLKFRSLRPVNEQESSTLWNVSLDDRLGRVGRFLRATSLDELPQLWNILRGDMTLVGPRPERPHFVDEFSRQHTRYLARHRVPAGLTGWAQVHGLRGDTSIEERARFDNYYIENWSLWGDVKIMVRTISATLQRQGS